MVHDRWVAILREKGINILGRIGDAEQWTEYDSLILKSEGQKNEEKEEEKKRAY